MRKFVITAASVAALALPTVAMAAAPDSSIISKPGVQSQKAGMVGYYSANMIQNLQFIAGDHGSVGQGFSWD